MLVIATFRLSTFVLGHRSGRDTQQQKKHNKEQVSVQKKNETKRKLVNLVLPVPHSSCSEWQNTLNCNLHCSVWGGNNVNIPLKTPTLHYKKQHQEKKELNNTTTRES